MRRNETIVELKSNTYMARQKDLDREGKGRGKGFKEANPNKQAGYMLRLGDGPPKHLPAGKLAGARTKR